MLRERSTNSEETIVSNQTGFLTSSSSVASTCSDEMVYFSFNLNQTEAPFSVTSFMILRVCLKASSSSSFLGSFNTLLLLLPSAKMYQKSLRIEDEGLFVFIKGFERLLSECDQIKGEICE